MPPVDPTLTTAPPLAARSFARALVSQTGAVKLRASVRCHRSRSRSSSDELLVTPALLTRSVTGPRVAGRVDGDTDSLHAREIPADHGGPPSDPGDLGRDIVGRVDG